MTALSVRPTIPRRKSRFFSRASAFNSRPRSLRTGHGTGAAPRQDAAAAAVPFTSGDLPAIRKVNKVEGRYVAEKPEGETSFMSVFTGESPVPSAVGVVP